MMSCRMTTPQQTVEKQQHKSSIRATHKAKSKNSADQFVANLFLVNVIDLGG